MDLQNHKEQVDSRIGQLDDKITKNQQSDKQKFMLLDDQREKLQQAFAAEKSARDLMSKRKTKELDLMVTGMQTSFENERTTRKELAQRIHKVIKDRYNQS